MVHRMKLGASLVLYKNDPEMIREAIASLNATPVDFRLVVVDNSPSDQLSSLIDTFDQSKVDYFHNHGMNLGFSKAHNIAISKLAECDYYLVMNPDIYFDPKLIVELLDYLDKNQEVGLVQPKICFPDGQLQYLCKRYPTFFALFARRFIPAIFQSTVKNYIDWYEMRDSGYNQIIDVPYLSGCFMLFRKQYLDQIGYFDENIFMYLEDADITLRMSQAYRSVFYPHVQIFHHWARGSHKSLRLTFVTIQSAFYFFSKHGWKLW
jgi:GT2 family glycosyltransferase